MDQDETAAPRPDAKPDSLIAEIVGDGGGESVLLAQREGLRLYTDESALRRWARSDHGVTAFSTVGLLLALERQNRISPADVARFLAMLLQHNYRTVYFEAGHLQAALVAALSAAGGDTSFARVRTDPVLATLLATFADGTRPAAFMARRASDWLTILLQQRTLPPTLGEDVLVSLGFSLSQRGLPLPIFWADLVFRVYRGEAGGDFREGSTSRAWEWVTAASAAALPQRPAAAEALLWDQLPNYLFQRVDAEADLTQLQRDQLRLELPRFLPLGIADRMRRAFTNLTAQQAGFRPYR